MKKKSSERRCGRTGSRRAGYTAAYRERSADPETAGKQRAVLQQLVRRRGRKKA